MRGSDGEELERYRKRGWLYSRRGTKPWNCHFSCFL